MKLIELNQEKLDNFLAGQKQSQFLQSFSWGEFQKNVGFDVFRFGVEDEGELVAVVSLIKKKLIDKFNYFYAPRGPVSAVAEKSQIPNPKSQTNSNEQNSNNQKAVDFLFQQIKKIAKKEKCIFLRFEPTWKLQETRDKDTNKFQISNFKFQIYKTIDLQPPKTLMLDLTKTEEELLADMHQKTRYNIRLAEKKGVEVLEGSEKDFEDFWELMQQTNTRDGFRLHSKEYYREMLNFNKDTNYKKQVTNKLEIKNSKLDFDSKFEIRNSKLNIRLFLAKYKGKLLSANIVSTFGDTATYMHGASSNEDRNIMAPYLLQWEVIKKAKQIGVKYYDFFGVDSEKWPGVTRYKLGFCEKNTEKHLINYPGTYDLVFSGMWYNVYMLLRKIRRMTK